MKSKKLKKSNFAEGILVALLMTAAGMAQSPSPTTTAAAKPDAGVPATHEDIQRLFSVMHVREQMRSNMQLIMAQQQKMIRETIKQRAPALTDEQLNKMEAISKEAIKDMPLDGMLDDTIPIYQQHLTKSDVNAMTRFYSSATGQKLLREQPAIARESMQAVSPRMQKAMSDIMDHLARMADEEAGKTKSVPEPPKN
jgi:hypothetical protein